MVPSAAPVAVGAGSGFGFRVDPFTGRAALHTGLDFPVAIGTPIRAAAGGVVISTLTLPSYGQMVEIDHGNRLHTRYAHSSKILVRTGQMIKRGDVVALVGSTGRSTGAHLHYETRIDGEPVDPTRFLAGRGNAPAVQAAAERPRRVRAAADARHRPQHRLRYSRAKLATTIDM